MAKADIQAAEDEIDREIVQSDLRKYNAAQSLWSLLTVIDNYYFDRTSEGDDIQFFHFTLTQIVDIPLRCYLDNHIFPAGPISLADAETTKRLAFQWLDRCRQYQGFEVIFPLWRSGRIELAINGNELVCKPTNWEDPYDAYNTIYTVSGKNASDPIEGADVGQASYLLVDRIRFDGRLYDVNLDIPTIREFYKLAPMVYGDSAWGLPSDWALQHFTFGEYRNAYNAILAVTLAWFTSRVVLRNGNCTAISGIARMQTATLVRTIRELTGMGERKVAEIVQLITYGSSGIEKPQVLLQPLIVVGSECMLTPIVWFNTNPENNLCSLANKIPALSRIYSRLKNQKEDLMFHELRERLTTTDRTIIRGKILGTNIDAAIIDKTTNACLCIEMKWFIEPASIRECENRAKELEKGVRQAKLIYQAQKENRKDITNLLKLPPNSEFEVCVVSMNWIGNAEHQDDAVRIVKFRHLMSVIERHSDLRKTIDWLRAKRYLPTSGEHYKSFTLPVRCGRWESKIGAFRHVVPSGS